MRTNLLFNHLRNAVNEPYRGVSYAVKSLSQKVASVAISGVGNFPLYGIAAAFGKTYSSFFGGLLGVSEYTSYFFFRIRNFEEIFQNLFSSDSVDEPISEQESILPSSVPRSDEEAPNSSHPSRSWKAVAKDVAVSATGIIAQYPLMVLAYYNNGKKLVYPVIIGVCEGAFTILSLLKSFKSVSKITSEETLEDERKLFIQQIDRFLEELPSKYKDPEFVEKVSSIFSGDPPKTEEEITQAVLDLILGAEGLPEVQKGSWDKPLGIFAKGVGLFISLYLTTVNAAVSYEGIKAWKEDQEFLAIFTAIFVSLANLKLLNELCIDSAFNHYESLRDLIKRQYRFPLAHAVSPIAWYTGRTISTALSWLSFGTTAISARDYFPKKVGRALIGPAPLSSALLLNDNLNWTADDLILWANSKTDPAIEPFRCLNKSLLLFRNKVKNADPESLRQFLSRGSSDLNTPLLNFAANKV